MKKPIHMPTYIKEKCDLAYAYVDDGAYYSAARVLEALAHAVKLHAEAVTRMENEL